MMLTNITVTAMHLLTRAIQVTSSLLLLIAAPTAIRAAGITLTSTDRNLGIQIQDALPGDRGTRLLYRTSPDEAQAHVRDRCTANFYLLDLQPGLPAASPQLLAENFCGYGLMSGTLLANGDVLIIAGDQVESWRPGSGKVNAWKFSDVGSLSGIWKEINAGAAALDVSRNGNIVMARDLPRQRNDTAMPSAVVIGLSVDGARQWQFELQAPGVLLGVSNIWATGDDGALLHATARPMSEPHLPDTQAPPGATITHQDRLYRISATGELSAAIVIASATMPDFTNPVPLPDVTRDPSGFQAALERQQTLSNLEAVDQIAAHPHSDGRTDVLIRRGSNAESRKGSTLYRVGSDGKVAMEISLEKAITGEGLRTWTDFSADDNQVVLYGAVGTRQNRLPQGFLSRIVLANGQVVTHLAPLDELGLEAAKGAADEQVQFLEHHPAQQPVLLTRLGERPLMISLIRRSRRAAIQIDEGTDQLAVFTEARN